MKNLAKTIVLLAILTSPSLVFSQQCPTPVWYNKDGSISLPELKKASFDESQFPELMKIFKMADKIHMEGKSIAKELGMVNGYTFEYKRTGDYSYILVRKGNNMDMIMPRGNDPYEWILTKIRDEYYKN